MPTKRKFMTGALKEQLTSKSEEFRLLFFMLQFLSPKKEDSPCWNSGLIRKSRLLKINHFNYYPLNLYWVISISTIAFRYHFNVYRNWGYFLICRYFKLHFAQSNPTGLLYRLFTWVPIALLFALIFVKPCLTC